MLRGKPSAALRCKHFKCLSSITGKSFALHGETHVARSAKAANAIDSYTGRPSAKWHSCAADASNDSCSSWFAQRLLPLSSSPCGQTVMGEKTTCTPRRLGLPSSRRAQTTAERCAAFFSLFVVSLLSNSLLNFRTVSGKLVNYFIRRVSRIPHQFLSRRIT